MKAKAKGNRNERRAGDILRGLGYELVIRSGGSLGLFDLIGLAGQYDHVLLVQVKSNRKLGKFEMDLLKSFQVPK